MSFWRQKTTGTNPVPSRKTGAPPSRVVEPWDLAVPSEDVREPTVWVLADDRAGNVSQATGVAEALGWRFEVKPIAYTWAATLPNGLRGASLSGLDAASRAGLQAPWPDVVIAAGRRTAPVARWIKRQSGGRAFLCQIMWPGRAGVADFDLVAVPTHDTLPGLRPNVLRVTGAPHRVTEARLALEAAKWAPRLDHLPHPRIAVCVGGTTRKRAFTVAMATELGERVSQLAAASGGALLVTTSRRTGQAQAAALFAAMPEVAHAFRWGVDRGDNPYFGYLALADAVVVTGDSVSMVCEACASPGPVYVFAPPKLISDKHGRLHRHLQALGMAEPLTGDFTAWRHPPLNAASDIAAVIRLRMAERQPRG
jgi:mitochondrial fission protein ELM1